MRCGNMTKLPRTLKLACYGSDVDGVKRTVYRFIGGSKLSLHVVHPDQVRRMFGPFFRIDVNVARGKLGLAKTGVVDQNMWYLLEKKNAPDAKALALIQYYAVDNPSPSIPTGPSSLDRSLWPLFKMAQEREFTNSGIYNPDSRLPSGRPSDHALWPALAFDAGFTPQVGMANQKAKDFFDLVSGRPEVEYVICGGKIWSRSQGLHNYIESYSHAGHIHVSGRR